MVDVVADDLFRASFDAAFRTVVSAAKANRAAVLDVLALRVCSRAIPGHARPAEMSDYQIVTFMAHSAL